jgi:RHS repeat-associated protein
VFKKALPALLLFSSTLLSFGIQAQTTVVGSVAAEFNVDNGAASYSIPIGIEPGRGGMQPELSLVYSSNSGNGILGMGWSLSGLSAIHRCGRTIAQDGEVGGVHFDERDRYCLDGQRLVPVSGAEGGVNTEYRTELDGYSQIRSVGGSLHQPDHWVIKTKAGQVMTYGGEANTSVNLPQGKASWSLSRINDTTGNNSINYQYEVIGNSQYLTSVSYVGGRVELSYGSRPDPSTAYFQGTAIEQDQRLEDITVYGVETLVKRYTVLYQETPEYAPSLIEAIRLCDGDNNCYVDNRFEWSAPASTARPFKGKQLSTSSFGDPNLYRKLTGDFNGDGITDIAWAFSDTRGAYAYTNLSNGDGTFSPLAGGKVSSLSFGTLDTYRKLTGDFNGDGITDIGFVASGAFGLYAFTALGKGDGGFHPASGGVITTTSFGSLDTYRKLTGDLNGDGLTDLLWVYSGVQGLYVYSALSKGDGSFHPLTGSRSSGASFGAEYLYDKQLGDYNGDGLLDIAWVYSGELGVYAYTALGQGDGRFGAATGRQLSTSRFGTHDTYQKHSADLNRDGVTDLLWVFTRSDGAYIYSALGNGTGGFLSLSGGRVEDSQVIGESVGPYVQQVGDTNGDGIVDLVLMYSGEQGASAYTVLGRGDGGFSITTGQRFSASRFGTPDAYQKRLGDFDGDGVTDMVWMYSSRKGIYAYTANSNKTALPYQLDAIVDATGNTTRIHYKPLTESSLYTKGSGAQFPVQDVQFPQYVVSQVDTANGIGGTTTVQYQYEGLKIHAHGRGSYGFAKVTETYPDTGKQLMTEYDQRDFPYAGQVLSVEESYQEQVVNQSTYTSIATEATPGVFQRYLQQSTQTSYELGQSTTPVTTVTTQYDDVDTYGNVGLITVTTEGGGQRFTKITEGTYTNDTTNWFLGRLTESTVTHQSPYGADEVRRTAFDYDSQTGLLNQEQIVSVNTGQPLITTRYNYNTYGQKTQVTISAQGESDRTTTTQYNAIGRPIQTCNVLNECESYTYTAEGWLASQTGPNGITTSYSYNGFGRQVREDRADGTWSQTEYAFASSGQCGELAPLAYSCTIGQSSSTPEAIVQYDALGRAIRQIKTGFDGRLIYSDTEYNALAQVARVSRDYYAGNHIYWATSEYDALERVTRVTEPGPHGSTNEITTEYNGLTSTTYSGPERRANTTHHNAIGQKVRVEEEEGTYIEYTYRSDGNLLTSKVAGDNSTLITLSYDEFGRKIAMDDPDMGQWTYTYDAFGQLISQTDAKNQTVTHEYDILGRLTKRTEAEGVSTWVYGDNTAPQGSIGKLLQESGNGLTKDYSYDNLGRPESTTTTIQGQGSFTTELSYDHLGRVKRTTYPGTQGFFTENRYNDYGFLSAVTGLRSQAEAHDYSQLQPLIAEATTLAGDYLSKADELKALGQYYQSQISYYQSLVDQGITNGGITSDLQQSLSQHQQQLTTTVNQGQALSPEFIGHLNNTVLELQTVSNLLNSQAQQYDALAEQLVVLAEQTLAAADHNFQYAHTLDASADAYADFASEQGTDTITYWRAVDMDASGRLSAEVYGNGIVNDYAYNQATGHLQSIHSSLLVVDALRHLEYQYDAYHNVTLRHDLVNDIHETYEYDRLERLTATHVRSDLYQQSTDLNTTQTQQYDVLGNITYKSDVGHYTYGSGKGQGQASNNAGTHAVTQAGNKTYLYDANGNMISGDGRTIQWSSFNKPTQITRDGKSAAFSYGPDRARFKKVNHQGDTTLYIGSLYEQHTKANNEVEQKHYIYAAGQLVAEHIVSTNAATQTRYLHKDALGSVDLVTDAYANVVDRRSFDAWGKLRELPWQSQASLDDPLYLTQLPYTNKGYTGHEHVQEVGLIHMNGRMYDATLARFISADPHIQAPGISQSYNRYSYVLNNPLKYNDPSGFFFKKLFSSVKRALGRVWKAVKPYVGIAAAVAVAAFCRICSASILAATLSGAAVGAIGAAAAGGNILEGAIIGGLTAGASHFIGGAVGIFGPRRMFDIGRSLAHGVVGGTVNVIRGGKFGAGFISSAFTKFVSGPIQSVARGLSGGSAAAEYAFGTAGAALVGGTASRLGGGKFANGARTAAIQYMFNQAATAAETRRQEIFEEARSYFAGEENIEYIDDYVVTYNNNQDIAQLGSREELGQFLKSNPDAVVRYGAFYPMLNDKIIIFRSSVESFNGVEGINYDASGNVAISGEMALTKLNLNPIENAIFSLGHELAHRQGIDMDVSYTAEHGGGNAAGLIACRNVGYCSNAIVD